MTTDEIGENLEFNAVDVTIGHIIECFKEGGGVQPQFFIKTAKGINVIPIPGEFMQTRKSKDIFAKIMKSIVEDIGTKEGPVETIIFASEVYMLVLDVDEVETINDVKESEIPSHPNTVSKLMITIEEKENVRLLIYDIVESDGCNVISEKPQKDETTTKDKVNARFLFL